MADRLIDLFSETLNVPAEGLDEESSPDNTPEWDSLAAMNLVAMIEDTFSIELSTKDIMKMRTIGIVREVLMEKGLEL
jgi:acyl carrier protein